MPPTPAPPRGRIALPCSTGAAFASAGDVTIGRREFARQFGAALAGLGAVAVGAQPAARVYRVGFFAGTATADGKAPQPLRKALDALGFVEGRNVVYEARFSGGRAERLPPLVAELLAQKLDVLVVGGGPPGAAARQATASIPIVAVNSGDLVETGMVASLARPGGNITGVNDPAALLSTKRLEILRELVPGARRVAVLWNAGDQAMTLRFREIERAAQLLRVAIDALPVREPDDFDVALVAMDRARPDALMMVTDALTTLNRQRVVDYAAARRIPAMYEVGAVVRAGGLMSYGADAADSFKLAAEYVAKILRGVKPADLPVEQPNRYVFIVNMKTIRSLGLVVPQSLLLRADEVIE